MSSDGSESSNQSRVTTVDTRTHSRTPSTPTRVQSESQTTFSVPSIQTLDTPMRNSSHGPFAGHKCVSEMRPIIEAELRGCTHDANEKYVKNVFRGKVASDGKISEFLASCKLYDSRGKRWAHIPQKPTNEAQLYPVTRRIINSILIFFALSRFRIVMDTHAHGIPHVEGHNDSNDVPKLKSSPDFMTLALEGSNFPPLKPSERKAALDSTSSEAAAKKPARKAWKAPEGQYPLCATPIEIKRQVARNQREDLVQVAVYVRQCFIQQQNRKFVYALIITEMYLTLYHFDRSGVIQSTRVDIHRDAVDFVRIILGVCSLDPAVLGFDTSIYYKDGQRHLKTVDGNNKAVIHTLATTTPMFSRKAIRGRGTVCWKVIKKNGTPLLVKDAWRSKGRDPEYNLLKLAVGLQGVGQMVSYELKELNVSTMRGVEAILGDDHFMDRIFTRITMEAYGESIDHFKTRKQFLYAFYDAVAGHRNLWNQSILHRDVSVNNILLGKKDAAEGDRGILIDLDMAIKLERTSSLHGADFRTGTRAFQSCMILRSAGAEPFHPNHDHTDDLESFFYVFCWIVLGYSGPGKPIEPRNPMLARWEQDDPVLAESTKGYFLLMPRPIKLPPFFGEPCSELLGAMVKFFREMVNLKNQHMLDETPPPTLLELKDQAVVDYKTILSLIKHAIDKVEEEDNSTPAVPPVLGPSIPDPSTSAARAPTAQPRKQLRPRPPTQHSMVTRRTTKSQDTSD